MEFTDCSLLAIVEQDDKSTAIRRISQDKASQKTMNTLFSDGANELLRDRSPVKFTEKYTPEQEDMEYLTIENFELPEYITKALSTPANFELYMPIDGKLPKIKALFMGYMTKHEDSTIFTVAFQKFKPDQYITAAKHHLFLSGDTFISDKRLGISVSPHIDCVYEDGQLCFQSFFYARQILDLSKYYRLASRKDVLDFTTSTVVTIENAEDFADTANDWERKRIASIQDSGLFRQYSPNKIKQTAVSFDIPIEVKNKKLVLPTDKKERRLVLAFLDDAVFRGTFSRVLYQTNSKRKAK